VIQLDLKSGSYFSSIDPDYSINYKKEYNFASMINSHYHDHYELNYLLSDEHIYFVKDKVFTMKKGSIMAVNIYDLHRSISSGAYKYERIVLAFKKRFIEDILKSSPDLDLLGFFTLDHPLIKLDATQQSYVENILFNMINEDKSKMEGYSIYVKTLIVQLLIYLNRVHSASANEAFEYNNPKYKKISEIIQYINSSYSNKLTLSSISSNFYISPNYFCSLFKSVTGFTFIDYLNNLRIKEAQRLLCETDSKISEISEKVGYESMTHFGRVFKSITGISPLKYRNINKNIKI